MAETRFARGDALTVEHWATLLEKDIVYRSDISALIGEDENSIIHMNSQTSKDAGDKITCGLMAKLTGDGFTESEIASGNGESLSLYSDSIVINELGHVVDVPNAGRSIDAQRVPFDLPSAARWGLRTWFWERMSVTFFNHVCGNTVETRSKFTGNNSVTAPTRTMRIDSAGATVSNDQSLVAADTFTLQHVDYARELAETADVPVRPINVTGKAGGQDISGGRYVMYLHPYQVTALRTSTDTGQWLDIQKSAMEGGRVSKNPIFTDALGEYNNVILKKANHVTKGVHSSTGAAVDEVRRAVLLGAQAAAIGFGKGMGKSSFRLNQELEDHKRRREISAFTIFGMKKCQYRSADHSVVTVPTRAEATGV